jgi:DNA invertase Pin-like site-specific DNA recombinase
VLPKNLDTAIRQLDDQQLERLLSATLEERTRRKKDSVSEGGQRKRRIKVVAAPLTQGRLNAVRAAFKAGVTPSRIAREFGISQSDVRKALANDGSKA